MNTIKATVRGGRLELDRPIDLPDGTELLIPLPEDPKDDAPMSPEEIEHALLAMESMIPFDYSPEEEAFLEADRIARKRGEPGQRPSANFDRERAVYGTLKADLLVRMPGRFVVLVDDEFIGPFETREEALRAGYARFGIGPLFVKQVMEVDPVVELTRDVTPCRI